MRGFRGFTLVEILVGVVILSFLIAGIFRVLNIGRMTYSTDLALMDLDQNAHRAMEWMVKETRQTNTELTEGNLILVSTSDITFNIPPVTWADSVRYYHDVSNSQIIRVCPTDPVPTRILANDINSLQFSLNNRLLEIQLTANKVASGRDLSLAVREKVHLRNE